MATCASCGTEVLYGARFCPKCGAGVTVESRTTRLGTRLGLVAAVILVLASLAIAATIAAIVGGEAPSSEATFFTSDDEQTEETGDLGPTSPLHDACDDRDMAACDELYYDSPSGSDEEEFGSTCGDRTYEHDGSCEGDFDPDEGSDYDFEEFDSSTLHQECADGDMAACDVLYYESDPGSEEEEFGSTCGDTTYETEGGCEDDFDY